MSETPYTTDDLRAEAARQHATLTEDADFMGVGEAMEDRYVESTVTDPDARIERTGSTWAELLPVEADDGEAYDEARRSIHKLISHAADVSAWAVNLGADGLEPEDHDVTLKADERPIVRAHFAFAPELSNEARTAFVEGIGASAAHEMGLVLEEQAAVTIPTEAAAHVLFQEGLGGWPPSTFASKLLNLWTSADTGNADHLAVAFPEYAAAIDLVRSGQQGIEQLRAIAGDSQTT